LRWYGSAGLKPVQFRQRDGDAAMMMPGMRALGMPYFLRNSLVGAFFFLGIEIILAGLES